MFIAINIDSISSAVGSVITLTFAVYFFISYLVIRKEPLHLAIAVCISSFFIYLAGYSVYSSVNDPVSVLLWTRICYSGGALIVFTSCILSSEIIQKKSVVLNYTTLLFSLALIIMMFLPVEWFFTGNLNPDKTHSSVIKGPLFPHLLAVIYIADFFLIIRFIRGLLHDKEKLHIIAPLLFGLVFWFLEAIFDGVFGAVLSMINMKLSLGPIVMTFSIAVYSSRIAELRDCELVRIKKEKEQIYNSLIYDQLSNLFSRAYFLETLQQRTALLLREKVRDCLMFIDIDNFKSINDELGHRYGDKVISYAGTIFKSHSRKSDICARYGGDEFLVLLENCQGGDALNIAEKIKMEFIRGLPGVLNNWNGSKDVSLSIGINCSENWTENPGEIIRKADLAMYEAKRKGRNMIVFYTGSLDRS